jgi:hypothetical protein
VRRREFITLVGGAASVWPLGVHAQQSAMPMIGFIRDGSAEGNARYVGGFRKGLSETGFVEGQNVTVEYHWLEGKYDRLPELLADLIRRQVAVIATLGYVPTQAAGQRDQNKPRAARRGFTKHRHTIARAGLLCQSFRSRRGKECRCQYGHPAHRNSIHCVSS